MRSNWRVGVPGHVISPAVAELRERIAVLEHKIEALEQRVHDSDQFRERVALFEYRVASLERQDRERDKFWKGAALVLLGATLGLVPVLVQWLLRG